MQPLVGTPLPGATKKYLRLSAPLEGRIHPQVPSHGCSQTHTPSNLIASSELTLLWRQGPQSLLFSHVSVSSDRFRQLECGSPLIFFLGASGASQLLKAPAEVTHSQIREVSLICLGSADTSAGRWEIVWPWSTPVGDTANTAGLQACRASTARITAAVIQVVITAPCGEVRTS